MYPVDSTKKLCERIFFFLAIIFALILSVKTKEIYIEMKY